MCESGRIIMKKLIGLFFKSCFLFVMLQGAAFANYEINEAWSTDNRSQIKVECSSYTNVCKQLCNNQKVCVLKNSTCKDCISTGVKMTYLFSSFGKDLNSNDDEVSIYEFVDFLINDTFIAFSPSNIYNQFDSAQSDALAERFKVMCPNKFKTPIAFFKIENRVLDIQNARYVTCGDSVYRLELKSSLLE